MFCSPYYLLPTGNDRKVVNGNGQGNGQGNGGRRQSGQNNGQGNGNGNSDTGDLVGCTAIYNDNDTVCSKHGQGNFCNDTSPIPSLCNPANWNWTGPTKDSPKYEDSNLDFNITYVAGFALE